MSWHSSGGSSISRNEPVSWTVVGENLTSILLMIWADLCPFFANHGRVTNHPFVNAQTKMSILQQMELHMNHDSISTSTGQNLTLTSETSVLAALSLRAICSSSVDVSSTVNVLDTLTVTSTVM